MLKTRTLSRLLPLLFLLPFVSQSGYAGIPGENDLNQMASDAISKVGTYKSMPINLLEETKFQGVSLSIDSLRYIRGNDVNGVKDDHVYINAEADIQLPFAVSANGDKVIKFKGINLPLAGEGNIRIGLVSTHEINIIKDKVKMIIEPSLSSGTRAELGDCKSLDSTFVEFNCNGVKEVGLVGHFEFSNSFFDHQYVQEIYVFYKDELPALISVDNKMSDDFQTTQDSNTFKCDEQKFYFIPNGKCIKALEKKYEYIDSPELPLQYIDSLSKHTPYIESNCTMGDSVRNELTKLLEKY